MKAYKLHRMIVFVVDSFTVFGLARLPRFAEDGNLREPRPTRRGLYATANNDLVADIPAKTRDPSVIVFAYTPVEDPAVYENAFRPFTEYLGKCTGKRVVYYPVQSNSAEIEAMRPPAGRWPAFHDRPGRLRRQHGRRSSVRR